MVRDWFDIDDLPPAEAEPRAERELVPDGEAAYEIKHQEVADGCLKLRLAHGDKRYGWVFCDLYAARKDGKPNERTAARIRELAGALGMTNAEWSEAVRNGDLVGRRVLAKTRQWQPETGRTRVQVDKFSAVPREAEPKPAARSKSSQPAIQSDDIPF